MTKKFTVFVVYEDDSEFSFDVELCGTPSEIDSELMMITRGTLMASVGIKASAYNEDGFDVCSYVR